MLSTSVSLPDVGGSRRAPKSLMSSSGVERSLYSGDSSAGPGTYGSVQYIEGLETKLMGSKKSEGRMSSRVQKLEEEVFLQRQKNDRLRMTGQDDDAGAEERATRLALDSCRRDLRKSVKKNAASAKTYEGRVHLLEETVGDVQTELTVVLSKLRYTTQENENMKEEMEIVEIDKGIMAKERANNRETMGKERLAASSEIESLTEERDQLKEQLKVSVGGLKQKNEMLEREVRGLRDQIKPMEVAVARCNRLEEQVKDLNEARKARQMYEDRMRVMEEQRDKAGEEKRAQKKRLEELEAQIAATGDVAAEIEAAKEATEARAAQLERLESWLPIMSAQVKKTKGKEGKKFVMVRDPLCPLPATCLPPLPIATTTCNPIRLHPCSSIHHRLVLCCCFFVFAHLSKTGFRSQLMDNFRSIMGMEGGD